MISALPFAAAAATLALALPPQAPLPEAPSQELAALVEEEKTPRDVSEFNLGKDGLALHGYDPVTYFAEGGSKPKKGSDKITLTHDGVTYRFLNEKNKAAFEKNPTRFEPLYGGWCAYAMVDGSKVDIDPESYIVTEEGLFVFYKGLFNNTRKKWKKKGADKLKPKADKQWKKLLDEAAKKKKGEKK